MDVTDVLRDRMHEPVGLERMTMLSVVAHGTLLAVVLLAPGLWFKPYADTPKTVMTISLGGGAVGPLTGGLTPEAARPVQEVRAPEDPGKPEAIRAPAARTPEMTLPEKDAKQQKPARTPVKEAPEGARGSTPTRGEETSAGNAAAYTGARGQGFGLSTGGTLGPGAYLDVGDFCCPEYLAVVKQRIESSWNARVASSGQVVVRFTIERNGLITHTSLEQSSGNAILDITAQRAILVTSKLPPLPAAFPNATLTVHYNFQYQR